MEELQPEELEELAQELGEESEKEEALSPEVEELLRDLQQGSWWMIRQGAALRLGKLSESSSRIVQALIAAAESDSILGVREAAMESLRAPAHQEILQQYPDLGQRAQAATKQVATQRENTGISTPPEADRAGWATWLLWVVASAVGLVLGSALERVFTIDLSAHMLLGGGTVGVLGGLALPGGLVIGTCQWLVLRRELDRAGWWILASTPMLIVGQLYSFYGGLTVRGLGFGLAQWLVLRREVDRAGWWIMVSAVGWTVGMAVGNAVFWELGWLLANALAGAVTGAITGAGLVWLLRQ